LDSVIVYSLGGRAGVGIVTRLIDSNSCDGKIHHVPGWNPETCAAFEAIEKNLAVLERAAAKMRVGGVASV